MFCRSCGAQNDNRASTCASCGAALGTLAPPAGSGTPGTPIPNYLVQAILTTVFCCLPFGIVAIVYAAQVNSKQSAGDIAGALETSKKAKTWMLVSFGVGLGIQLLYVGFMILAAVAGVEGGPNPNNFN